MQRSKILYRLPILSVLAIIALLGSAPLAQATSNTKIAVFQDVPPGGSSADVDFIGPTGFGFVSYNQDDETGDMRLTVSLKGVAPGREFGVFLTNGPTHDTAIGFIFAAVFTTNVRGNGTVTVTIPISQLSFLALGADSVLGHVDITTFDFADGVYVAGGVNWTVP